MTTVTSTIKKNLKASSETKIGIVASNFNESIVNALLEGAKKRLKECGVLDNHIEVIRVPGSFELPLASLLFAEAKPIDVIISIGVIIRGETAHFDYVAKEAAAGLQKAALKAKKPIIFGVLTCDNETQAWQRAGVDGPNLGEMWAESALEMTEVVRALRNS